MTKIQFFALTTEKNGGSNQVTGRIESNGDIYIDNLGKLDFKAVVRRVRLTEAVKTEIISDFTVNETVKKKVDLGTLPNVDYSRMRDALLRSNFIEGPGDLFALSANGFIFSGLSSVTKQGKPESFSNRYASMIEA